MFRQNQSAKFHSVYEFEYWQARSSTEIVVCTTWHIIETFRIRLLVDFGCCCCEYVLLFVVLQKENFHFHDQSIKCRRIEIYAICSFTWKLSVFPVFLSIYSFVCPFLNIFSICSMFLCLCHAHSIRLALVFDSYSKGIHSKQKNTNRIITKLKVKSICNVYYTLYKSLEQPHWKTQQKIE